MIRCAIVGNLFLKEIGRGPGVDVVVLFVGWTWYDSDALSLRNRQPERWCRAREEDRGRPRRCVMTAGGG